MALLVYIYIYTYFTIYIYIFISNYSIEKLRRVRRTNRLQLSGRLRGTIREAEEQTRFGTLNSGVQIFVHKNTDLVPVSSSISSLNRPKIIIVAKNPASFL